MDEPCRCATQREKCGATIIGITNLTDFDLWIVKMKARFDTFVVGKNAAFQPSTQKMN